MTRQHAAYQLLKHGPLSLREFHQITGWKSPKTCLRVLTTLRQRGRIEMVKHGVYQAKP